MAIPIDKLTKAEINHLVKMGIQINPPALETLFQYISDQPPEFRCEECLAMFKKFGYEVLNENRLC